MAMIILSAQRAQRLARLQVDFVAGVSHELRTPLAVICSAGDNLADGVVAGSSEQAKRYGEIIRREGQRLTGMIEQILLFAGGRTGRRKLNLRPAFAGEIVESTLSKMGAAVSSAGFAVEKEIAPDLPMIRVDETILSQCLENLINNALKYGGERRWIRVRVAVAGMEAGREVQISVEDMGMGIERSDLPHIFEPFYRGKAATTSRTRGSGLGLSLVRDGVTALGGRISVKSTPGKGSVFTMHLPALPLEQLQSGNNPESQGNGR